MLESLQVHNFALLEDVSVEFTKGFNVFTGETGAGKSILIDAFGVVLGGRASTDFVRSGTDGYWIQAVFEVGDNPAVSDFLNEQGLDNEDELFLKRMVNSAGKSKASINGVQVPLAVLKQLGAMLVDIHGQHENQLLLQSEAGRLLTDEFGGAKLATVFDKYAEDYKKYQDLADKVDELRNANNDREHLLELYEHTLQEIDDAQLKPGEEEALEQEATLLQNGEKIARAIGSAHEILEGENGALSQLAAAKNALADVAEYDKDLAALYETLDSAWISLDDAGSELGGFSDKFDFNGERVNQVQTRLDLFYDLKKKYGATIEDVIAYGEEVAEKYSALQSISDTIAKAEKELVAAKAELTKSAAALTAERQKAAKSLTKEIVKHIKDLAMPEGKLELAFAATEFTKHGADDIRILFSANKGEPLAELNRVASGGELSRLALAVKTVLLNRQTLSCMVFDEIDTGVGGVTAERMAEKIAILSKVGQVLCITHLPQIAAFADRHIYIEKRVENNRTVTHLDVLLDTGRVEELVRMTAGSNKSAAAVKTAEELLSNAQKFKGVGRRA